MLEDWSPVILFRALAVPEDRDVPDSSSRALRELLVAKLLSARTNSGGREDSEFVVLDSEGPAPPILEIPLLPVDFREDGETMGTRGSTIVRDFLKGRSLSSSGLVGESALVMADVFFGRGSRDAAFGVSRFCGEWAPFDSAKADPDPDVGTVLCVRSNWSPHRVVDNSN